MWDSTELAQRTVIKNYGVHETAFTDEYYLAAAKRELISCDSVRPTRDVLQTFLFNDAVNIEIIWRR
jgi:hypothetical protein